MIVYQYKNLLLINKLVSPIGSRFSFKASALLSFYLSLIVILVSCGQPSLPQNFLISGPTMGTSYHITVVSPPANIDKYTLQTDIDKLLININRQMSTYIPDSEISKFNQLSVNTWKSISEDFFTVLELSESFSLLTSGRFDITIGPLVDLWGFGAATDQDQKIPDRGLLEQTLDNVGWYNLVLDKENRAIKKLKPININLSAIAKGYGVDKVAELLTSKNIDNYLVEIGGEVRARGLNKENIPWRLGIEEPSLMQKSVQRVVELTDQAIATSGDYRNYFEENGTRFSHTIDPTSGRPVKHNIASVSVIADNAATADALATALNVLGERAALELSERENIAAYFILYDNENTENQYRVVHSRAFSPFLNNKH
jgi:thiamine biosynthesis lipoprotein